MKKITYIIFLAAAGISASSCVHNDFDLEPCPSHVRVVPEWVNTQSRTGTAEIEIIPDNGPERDTTSTATGVDMDLAAQHYGFVAWEPTIGVTVDGRTVTVVSDQNRFSIEPEPFAGGATDATVIGYSEMSSNVQVIPVPMRQQTRELIITLNVIGDAFSEVTGVTADLAGIAISRDINNGFPPVGTDITPPALLSGYMHYDFVLDPDYTGEGWMFEDQHTLLGLDGNMAQTIYVTVTFDNDPASATQYMLDVTGGLVGFHTNQVELPWLLPLVLDLRDVAVFDIIDWEVGPAIPPITAE